MELYDQINVAKDAIRRTTKLKPEIGIILGTGLGCLGDKIDVEVRIPYEEIPHFPVSTVDSHAGDLLVGHLSGKPVLAMSGRFHVYEGYSMQEVTFPVRVARALGVETLIVSNACGGMNPQFRAGDLMVISDHINLMGDNPLIGPNDERLGPRFPDMSEPYSRDLIALAEKVALDAGVKLQRGVYLAVTGPCLETAAEYRFMRQVGGDVVGMSTVPEVIVAVHCGLKVLGFSAITDECLPDALEPVDIDRIVATANSVEPVLSRIVADVIQRM
jgi:purine-nucleoside phosphorylase